MSLRWTVTFLSCTLLAAAVGCGGSGVERYDVSGSVQFNGQPVPSGTISFLPALGNSGPGGFADIKDGKYDTAIGGKGPTGGPHTVSISGYDGNADPANELPLGLPLFDTYKAEVDLPEERSTQDFNVPPDARKQPRQTNPNAPV